ncbi:AAA family ATPase [Chitinophaga sancti]|uniref:AAA family ATPase n=2 Tax=Chitinophaga sancti TaxID=1004 RepID=A0A1K1R3N8_9BACT|nr:AAA family ATPase [Chitinophaga sancti]WQD64302.1 AAA family ATPase [Chitinophaga sancti]WQG90074.1 AAA family ATPase [Chitinophaga sancti]SFW66621.1 Predicted ATP-binding protein involved in virulence [Chitinophaga sancti]
MYIKSVAINNIRSVKGFKMEFKQPAGWHVLIGDNGAGKSTIIRSIALALIGPEEAMGLRSDWGDWLSIDKEMGNISLEIIRNEVDKHLIEDLSSLIRESKEYLASKKIEEFISKSKENLGLEKLKVLIDKTMETIPLDEELRHLILNNNYIFFNTLLFHRSKDRISFTSPKTIIKPSLRNWGTGSGWFSVAYGPFRRFAGGNPEWNKVYNTQPKLGAHLSAFGEDVALTEATEWLVKLKYQILEKKEDQSLIDNLKSLINSEDFLPHNTKLYDISSDGVIFKDAGGAEISVNQLSDGYRSILSLTFELLRQLVKCYGQDLVFQSIREGVMKIDLPGVVLIDEIDAHLHPSWQTRIGSWFTKYFPKIQFIVTTHSPLVCRASENGSIWKLASPGNDNDETFEIIGVDKEKLILGNVLDAYGTEFFGKSPVRSGRSNEKLERLGELNILAALGKISDIEEKERLHLQKILSTDDPFGSPTVK